MTDPLQVLSLGAGIQSSCVLLMSCKGELPKLDAAVFADTGWEPQAVYDNLEWLTEHAAKSCIAVHVVSCGKNLRAHTINATVREGTAYASLPLHVVSPSGTNGMLRRQCTREYKIRPIARFIRRTLLGLDKGERAPQGVVDLWLGISADEQRRIRQSQERWQRNVYPLCNLPDRMLPKSMTRTQCYQWLADNYPGREFPRSACIGCPYKTNSEWRTTKGVAGEWADAVAVDNAIRNSAGPEGSAYLHKARVALVGAALDEDQRELWSDECLGVCGV